MNKYPPLAADLLDRWSRALRRGKLGLLISCAVVCPQVSAEDYFLYNSSGQQFLASDGVAVGRADETGEVARWQLETAETERGITYYRLRKPDQGPQGSIEALHVENGTLEFGEVQPGWWSAMWELENLPGQDEVLLRNRWTSVYLNTDIGYPQATNIAASNPSTQWLFSEAKLSTQAPGGQSQPSGFTDANAAQANVMLRIQNFSDDLLGVFIDSDDGQTLVVTLPAGSEVLQETPVGATWHLAQNEEWVGSFAASAELEQLVQWPEK